MNKYDIRTLEMENKPRKGAVVTLPHIAARLSASKEYRVILRHILREMATEVRETILPAYTAARKIHRAQDDAGWFAGLEIKAATLHLTVKHKIKALLKKEAKRHNKTFMQAAQTSLGVNLEAVVLQEDLQDVLSDYAEVNASLITSLGDDTIKRIKQTVYAAKLDGLSAKQLRAKLQHQFGIVGSRATLIAQDQMNKLTADLNRIRQEQAGITEYDWFTSRDERVRTRHRALDGQRYQWGKPTGAEGGLPPGKPVRCRCIARAVITF